MRLSDINTTDIPEAKPASDIPKTGRVAVELPDGTRGDMDASELTDDIKIIPADQLKRESDFADAGEKPILASALGALRGVTLGASDFAIKQTGLLSEQELSDLQEANPTASNLSEIGGAIAPVFLSGGTGALAKIAASTPAAMAELAGKKVATKLTGKFLSSTTSSVVQNIVKTGAGSSVEASLYGAGKLLSEDQLGNAEFNAENLLATVAQNAASGFAFGGGVSLLGSGVSKAANATKDKFRQLRKNVISKANLDDVVKSDIINKISIDEKVDDYLTAKGVNKEDLLSAIDGEADKLADNAALIESGERLGVPLTEGMKTGGLFRELEGSLGKSKTIFGGWTRKRIQNAYDGLEVVGNTFLKEASDIDPHLVGVHAKQGMRAAIETELEPAKLLYQELKPIMESTPITQSLKKKFITERGDDYYNRVAGDGESWLKKLDRAETIDDITKLRSDVRSDMAGAIGTQKKYLSDLYDNLTTMRKNALKYNLKGKPFVTKAQQSMEAIDALELADNMYRETHAKYDFLKKQFNIKSSNMDDFVDSFEKVSDKEIAGKILSLKNLEHAKQYQQYFPEVYDMARAKRLSEIAKKSKSGDVFSPNKFYSSIEKLDESELAILFPGIKNPKQVVADFKKVADNLPPLTNPSGTAYELSLQNMLSLPYQAQEAARYLLYRSGGEKFNQRMSRFVPELVDGAAPSGVKVSIDQKIPVMQNIEKASNKGKITISDAVQSFLDASERLGKVTNKAMLRSMTGINVSEEKQNGIEEKVAYYSQDPQLIVDNFLQNNQNLMNSAPKTAQALQLRMTRAAEFLNSKVPKQDMSPFSDTPVSRVETQKFKSYVEAVENPYKVLNDLKHGYFTPESGEAFKVVYPSMFSALKEEFAQRLPEFKKITEKQKSELSRIMGLDSKKSYTPYGFAALQKITADGNQKDIVSQNRAPSSRSSKIDSAGREQTGVDRVLNRK